MDPNQFFILKKRSKLLKIFITPVQQEIGTSSYAFLKDFSVQILRNWTFSYY